VAASGSGPPERVWWREEPIDVVGKTMAMTMAMVAPAAAAAGGFGCPNCFQHG